MTSMRRLGGCSASLVFLVLFIWLAWLAGRYLIDSRFYRQALPEQIGVTALVGSGSDLSLAMALIPIRHEACGGVVFRLSDDTVAALEKDGLAHLQEAKIGRGYQGDEREHYYTYNPWQPTPVPPDWVSDGAWPGLHCVEWILGTSKSEIIKAAKEPGSYFSTKREAWIVIIPRLKIVAYTYFG